MRAPGRLAEPREFEDIVLRARSDTSLLRLKDIGRVELGPRSYSGFNRVNGMPSGNLIVFLAPGANAVETADRVRAFMEEAKKNFPAGMDYLIPYDSTVFVHAAINEVVITLFEAVLLVILVVFVFLQNWRATLIPLLTVMADRIWGIALVLVAYNAVHLWTMIRGFSHGYQKGPGGALEIGKILSLDRTRRISYSIPLLAGMVIGALSQWENAGTGLPVSLVIFLASAAAFRFKIGTFWIFYGVFTLTLIWTIIR